MSQTQERTKSRRGFLGDAAVVAGASALAAAGIPAVHAAGSDLIQVALIGCGGRGTGAAGEALSTKGGPIKLVAMADIFENRLNGSHANLARGHGDKVDVPPERRFLGFEAYRQAMDCLKPGDVAIFATPPAFRWVHFKYAIEKGLNVFMEKPVTVDGPTTRKMLALASVSPKIINALAADKIDLACAQAFTLTDDHKRQERVFKRARTAHEVRALLTETKVTTGHRLFRFVGADAYREAGGTLTCDLFAKAGKVSRQYGRSDLNGHFLSPVSGCQLHPPRSPDRPC